MERKNNWKSELLLRGKRDPVFWIENVLGDTLWERQKDICRSVVEHERTACVACFDDQTEILTENRGWQFFKDLSHLDKVASLENGRMVFVSPLDYFEGEYNGDMIGYKSKQLDFLVTPDHRCLVACGRGTFSLCGDWHIQTADQLPLRSRVYFNKSIIWDGIEDEWTEKHYELWGFWVADGSIHGNYEIWITQKNHKNYVENLLSVYEQPVRVFNKGDENGAQIFSIGGKSLVDWFVTHFNRNKSVRSIPAWLKQAPVYKLKAFLRGFFMGDGCYFDQYENSDVPTTAVTIYYEGLAEDIAEVALRAGYGVTIRRMVKQYSDKQYGGARQVVSWNISLLKNNSYLVATKQKFYRQPYKGKIYCVQVPSGLILVRRNGLYHWSGNSFGVGKCVGFNERIPLSDGRFVYAKDLIGLHFGVLAFDEETYQQIPTLAFATDNGVKTVFEITTKLGRKLIRTENHPLYSGILVKEMNRLHVKNLKFREIKDLKIGDAVLIPKVLNNEGSIRGDDRDAKLVGYLLGDGGTFVGVNFTQMENKQKQEFISIVESFGGKCTPCDDLTLRVTGEGDTSDNKKFEKGRNPILNKAREWGLLGKTSKTKKFPDWVWTLPNDQLALVINRYFSCDGWAYVNERDASRANVRIGVTSASEEMIRDVELAMLRFGIVGMIRKRDFVGKVMSKSKGKEYDVKGVYWTWECYKAKEVERFSKLIGIFGKEAELEKAVRLSMQRTNFTKTAKWIHEHTTDEFIWDTVKAITYVGEQSTVAISVPKYHTYISTIVEHNTHIAARLALWFLCTHKPSIVVSTAPCFDIETEILTDQGWKFFKDLNKKEKVASLVDGKLEFVEPLDWMIYPVEGELLGYQGRDIDFLVTPQHKLYTHRPGGDGVFKLIRADEVYGKWDYSFNRHCEWEGTDDDWTELHYELFGFWMADGSAFYNEKRKVYGVCITQSKHISYVEKLLTACGFKYSKECKKAYDNYLVHPKESGLQGYNFVIYSKEWASWFIDNFGRLKIDRRVPRWLHNATKVKIQAFLRGFMLADGCEQKESKRIRVYGNKGLANDLQELGIKAGYVVNMHWQYCGNRLGATIEDSWALNFLSSAVKSKEYPASNKKHWYKKWYEGNVYCVQVPSGVILVRRNGVYHWSGNTLRQVKDLLWSEIRDAHRRALIPIGGDLLQLSLKFDERHFAVGFSTDAENMDKFTGLHQANQLVIFDQAGGIEPTIWEASEGLMTSAYCRWLAISNSAISDGELANICMPDRKTRFGTWNVLRIKASESPNVLAGKNIVPGLVAHDWVKKREEAWGRDDPLYKIFVEAEFIPDSEMVVLPYRSILEAFESRGQLGDHIEIGLDVARMGTDSSVWVAVSGSRVLEIKRITGNTTMQVVGQTVEFYRYLQIKYKLPILSVKVDVIGLGAGVYDRLVELDDEDIYIPVVAVNNAEALTVIDRERYLNVRAEMAWMFRYRLEQGGVGIADVHVDDYELKDYLRGDMQAMRYQITSQGKIKIIAKEELKKILGRSPDYWDALVMAFETPSGGPPSVEAMSTRDEVDTETVLTEEEWQILVGTKMPTDDSYFRNISF